MSELISIVIPVYNKEPYLADCFDSLRKQTYEDIEVIMVDDGSTDGSAAVCRKYVEMDSRFHYIYQENGGQNSARQKGAENATGEYLIFVDADDYVSHDMCKLLMDNMKKTHADIVCGACQRVKDGHLFEIVGVSEGIYTPDELLRKHFVEEGTIIRKTSDFVDGSLCVKMYPRKIAVDAFRKFDMSIRLGEDPCMLFYIMFSLGRISYISDVIYYVRVVEGSTSRRIFSGYAGEQYTKATRFMRNFFIEKGRWPEYEYIVNAFLLKELVFHEIDVFDDFNGVYPYFEGDKRGRVALYGAGVFGNYFYNKVKGLDIVGWFDKNYAMYQDRGFPVKNPVGMKNVDFDYVLITVLNESTSKSIIKELRRTLPECTRIYAISQDILNSDYTRRKIRSLLDE